MVLGALSRLAIFLLRTIELVALLYVVGVCVLCLVLFLTVLCVGLQSVIVAFPSPIHLLLDPGMNRTKSFTVC